MLDAFFIKTAGWLASTRFKGRMTKVTIAKGRRTNASEVQRI